MTIFQDILNPYRHGSWTFPLIRLYSHPDTKSVNSLISLFCVPQKQQKFYIAFNWSVAVADHHSDCSDFCLTICVQIPEYTVMGASCYFLCCIWGCANNSNQCSDAWWEIIRQWWNHDHVMMMLTVLIPGSVIIQWNWRSLGTFSL